MSRSRLFAFLSLVFSVVLAALALVNVFHINFPPLGFLGLLSIPSLSLSLALFFISIVLQFKRVALVSAAAAILFGVGLLPWLAGRAMIDPENGPSLRIMFAHAAEDERTSGLFRNFVIREAPDLIAVLETSSTSATPTSPFLQKSFRYSRRFGKVSLYAKDSLDSVVVNLSRPEVSGFRINSRIGLINLRIVDMPQSWPYGGWGDYDLALKHLGSSAQSENNDPTLFIGDFNSTLSSAPLLKFSKQTGLKPATSPIGTWPAQMPPYLRLAIDNAFLSPGIKAVNFKVGPEYASDHRPILIEIKAPGTEAQPVL